MAAAYTYTLTEGDTTNEATLRANLVATGGGIIYVPATTTTCAIDTLDLSGGLNVTFIGENPFNAAISVKNNAYIDCQGSRVQFHNLRIVGGTTAKAAAVFCRAQSNGAQSRNQCGFWNCIVEGTYSVAAVVNYGMELFTMRDSQFYNSYDVALSYTVAFNPDQLTPFGYSANFTGHTNSGNCIDNCYIYHYGGVTGTAGIPLIIGDQTTDLTINAWLGGTSCPTLLDAVKYTPDYSRLRSPQRIFLDNVLWESGTASSFLRADDANLLKEFTLPQHIRPNTLRAVTPGQHYIQNQLQRKIVLG
jgi:hypothetical protein